MVPNVFEYETFELSLRVVLSIRGVAGFVFTPKKLFELNEELAALTEAENLPVPFVWGL